MHVLQPGENASYYMCQGTSDVSSSIDCDLADSCRIRSEWLIIREIIQTDFFVDECIHVTAVFEWQSRHDFQLQTILPCLSTLSSPLLPSKL